MGIYVHFPNVNISILLIQKIYQTFRSFREFLLFGLFFYIYYLCFHGSNAFIKHTNPEYLSNFQLQTKYYGIFPLSGFVWWISYGESHEHCLFLLMLIKGLSLLYLSLNFKSYPYANYSITLLLCYWKKFHAMVQEEVTPPPIFNKNDKTLTCFLPLSPLYLTEKI